MTRGNRSRNVQCFRKRNGTAWRTVKALRGDEAAKEVSKDRYGPEYFRQHLEQDMWPLTEPNVAKPMDGSGYRLNDSRASGA